MELHQVCRYGHILISSFLSTPKIVISPQLSKLVLYGINSNGAFIKFYYLDYSKLRASLLDFPQQSVLDVRNTYILLQQSWLYVRQLPSSQSLAKNRQFIYNIQFNSVINLAKNQTISQEIQSKWIRTLILITSKQNLGVYYEIAASNTIVVESYEVLSPKNTGRGSTLQSYSYNGQTILCTIGCSSCSATTCSICSDGYILDSNSNTCLKCAQNCLSCSPTDINTCYSCHPGSYLLKFTCLQCSKSCLTCSGAATSCLSCFPGFVYNSSISDCSPCSRNCLACSSNGTCTNCRVGFVAANSSCRSCISSCSSCLPLDVTTCTACYQGLQLINGACVSCPDKCNVCFNQSCISCIEGYHPNSNGTCVLDCMLPCATCSDNLPSSCLSCFNGSILSGKSCKLNLSCNYDNSCTSCGQGNNYILVGASCLACPNITNCLQCRVTNSKACSACATGYYINNNQMCSSCQTGCISCTSSTVCNACDLGYTLPNQYEQSQCIKCSSPCLTCRGSSNYCTSCIGGFYKNGWKCQSKKNIGFNIKLSANLANVLELIDKIVNNLLSILTMNINFVDAVTFNTIKQGSVDLQGTITPSEISSERVRSGTSQLSYGITESQSLGGFPVISASVVSNGIQDNNLSNSEALIIGLSVGVSLFAIIAVIIAVCIYHKRPNQQNEKNPSESPSKNVESIDFDVNQIIENYFDDDGVVREINSDELQSSKNFAGKAKQNIHAQPNKGIITSNLQNKDWVQKLFIGKEKSNLQAQIAMEQSNQ